MNLLLTWTNELEQTPTINAPQHKFIHKNPRYSQEQENCLVAHFIATKIPHWF